MSKLFALLLFVTAMTPLLFSRSMAEDLYRFDFSEGRYTISMPTSQDPKVEEYTDVKGGEFTWSIDKGGELVALYAMSHSVFNNNWTYSFDNCKELERDPTGTIKVNDLRWKYSVADVVLNLDDAELTYVDVRITHHAWEHVMRFVFTREEDHEIVVKQVKQCLSTIKFWD